MIKKIWNKVKLYINLCLNVFSRRSLYYITEPTDWVIKNIGREIIYNLDKVSLRLTTTPHGIKDSIVHYGSINMFINNNKVNLPHKSNNIVVTWFHIPPNDRCINLVHKAKEHVDIWHTSCSITKKILVDQGIPENRIIIIPLGVSLKFFKPAIKGEELSIRSRLGIPENKFVIGSFQKDGDGWGEGLEPKLIKGPDIFCNAVEKLSKKHNIFILLTGPARGYVKKRLEKANIPFVHHYFKEPYDIADYYKALDLYLITSRVEGGPLSIPESLACGIPLVSTKVGMAPDMISDGHNGFLAEIGNTDQIVKKAEIIIKNRNISERFIQNGLELVKKYDWSYLIGQYYHKLYKPLLKKI